MFFRVTGFVIFYNMYFHLTLCLFKFLPIIDVMFCFNFATFRICFESPTREFTEGFEIKSNNALSHNKCNSEDARLFSDAARISRLLPEAAPLTSHSRRCPISSLKTEEALTEDERLFGFQSATAMLFEYRT